jgi:hypothetical protein
MFIGSFLLCFMETPVTKNGSRSEIAKDCFLVVRTQVCSNAHVPDDGPADASAKLFRRIVAAAAVGLKRALAGILLNGGLLLFGLPLRIRG